MNDQAELAPTHKGDSDFTCTLDDACPGFLSHSYMSDLKKLREEVQKHQGVNDDQETHFTELLGHIRSRDADNSQSPTFTVEDKEKRLEGYRIHLRNCRDEASKSETFLTAWHDQAENVLAEERGARDHLRSTYVPRTYTGFENLVFQSPLFAEVKSALDELEQRSKVVAIESSRGSAKSGSGAQSENDAEFRQSASKG